MKRVEFLSLARDEVSEAYDYYNLQQTGLGKHFAAEVRDAVRRLTQYPLAFPVQRGEIRKCLLQRFPYKLLYAIRHDKILIVAIAHQHREPEYWVGRTDSEKGGK